MTKPKIDYQSLLNQNNFENFLQGIVVSDKNPQISKAAKEILFEMRGNKNIIKKKWYNALYEKYQFTLLVQKDKPPRNKVVLYTYETIVIPGSVIITQSKPIGIIATPVSVAAKPSYGPVTYKIFEAKTISNSTVCANGGTEIIYSYSSKTNGLGTAIFYSSENGCNEEEYNVLITARACLPSDATSFRLLNGNDLVSGVGPSQTPTMTNAVCQPAPILLTTVDATINNLISVL